MMMQNQMMVQQPALQALPYNAPGQYADDGQEMYGQEGYYDDEADDYGYEGD